MTRAEAVQRAAEAIHDVHGLFQAYDSLAGEVEYWRDDEIPATTPCPTGNFETIEPIRNQEHAIAILRTEIRKKFNEAVDGLDAALTEG